MKCNKVEILLSDLLDGRLDKASEKELHQHLDICPDCSTKYKKLQNYSQLVSKIESVDVPADIKTNTWKSIEEDIQEGYQEKTGTGKYIQAIVITALAASVLMLITLKPFGPELIIIDSSYSFVVEKKGKGPGEEMIYKKGTDPRTDRLLSLADSSGIDKYKVIFNPESGRTDCIAFKIPVEKYQSFRNLYNNEPGTDYLDTLASDYRRKHLLLQVYIPGRRFVTGDFNGDKYVDFGVYFTRGKYSGDIFISLNDSTGNFKLQAKVSNINEKIYLGDNDELVAGDFNGDGYDDLMSRSQDRQGKDTLSFYINIGDNKFIKRHGFTPEDTLLSRVAWKKILAGDINGDDFDDLVTVYFNGDLRGRFIVSINDRQGGFNKPYLMQTLFWGMEGNEKFTPLLMDINGDRLADPGIYWRSGDRNAYWYYILNDSLQQHKSSEFYAGFGKGHMAFMGNYLVYTGDTDADGYDELLVKLGTSDELSEWYLMHNRQDSTFSLGRPILFNEETDLQIR